MGNEELKQGQFYILSFKSYGKKGIKCGKRGNQLQIATYLHI